MQPKRTALGDGTALSGGGPEDLHSFGIAGPRPMDAPMRCTPLEREIVGGGQQPAFTLRALSGSRRRQHERDEGPLPHLELTVAQAGSTRPPLLR